MIGTKLKKPLADIEGYTAAAAWANENGAMIADKGEYYEVVPVPPPPPPIIEQQISKRDAMLAATDWYVIRASEPDGKPVPADVLAYRQALRDVDQQTGWPTDVNWPVRSV